MLARPDRLPRGDYGYEVKWDGFRAIVSTERGLEVRSRRAWEMSERLPELSALPDGLVLDGELVAYGADGRPSFPLLSLRVLLEGVVAKKRTERYLPGERGWVKTKNGTTGASAARETSRGVVALA